MTAFAAAAAATPVDPQAPVAVVGMAGMFPRAPDVATFWANILAGVDAVAEAPPGWLDNPHALSDVADDIARIYTTRGGFLGEIGRFDPRPFGIMPVSIAGSEPDQFLALRTAMDALVDAGCPNGPPSPERTGIILGHAIHVNRGNANGLQWAWILDQTVDLIETLLPDTPSDRIAELRQLLARRLPDLTPDSIPGLVPNMMTGRIANRLGLMGPNYIMDAACASMLMSAEAAINELRGGRADMMLAGGVNTTTSPLVYSVFCRLGALSRRGRIRPFDREADGTVLGEGLGIVVLKRLADAQRDGDRVYAVIRSVGQSSDGRGSGLMAPRLDGEILAMRRAYAQSGIDPATIGLVEAHGTSIPLGDRTEVAALRAVLGGRRGRWPDVPLGSVKSMIGHCIPAAGAAALIKTALALHHRTQPPTLCERVNPDLGLEDTPLFVNTTVRPWIHAADHPRRAAINAFGFGGVNSHMILEEAPDRAAPPLRGHEGFGLRNGEGKGPVPAPAPAPVPASVRDRPKPAFPAGAFGQRRPNQGAVVVAAGQDRADLLAALATLGDHVRAHPDQGLNALARHSWTHLPAGTLADPPAGAATDADHPSGGEGGRQPPTQRLAIVAHDRADLLAKLDQAQERLADPGRGRLKTRGGLYFAADPLALPGPGRPAGRVAVLFPGENSQYSGMLADLACAFPVVRRWLDFLETLFAADRDCGHGLVLYPPPTGLTDADRAELDRRLTSVDWGSEAVFAADQALYALLRSFGIRPQMLLGHSTGENAALVASGALGLDQAAVGAYIRRMNALFARLEADRAIPPAALLSVGALPRDRLLAVLAAHPAVTFTMDNCPNQAVVLGSDEAIAAFARDLAAEGAICQSLPLAWAYHTPAVAPLAQAFGTLFADIAPRPPQEVTLYSCATADPFPADPVAFRERAIIQYTSRVRFTEAVERLYADGARVFLEAGPGATLTGFVNDILRDRPRLAESLDSRRRDGVTQVLHLIAQVFVEGVPMTPAPLLDSAWPEPAPDTGLVLPSFLPYLRLDADDAAQARALLGLGTQAGGPDRRPVPAAAAPMASFAPASTAASTAPCAPPPAFADWSGRFGGSGQAGPVVVALAGPVPEAPWAAAFAASEHAVWDAELARSGPIRRADWLRGRLAAKEALRRLIAATGAAAPEPARLAILAGADGRPRVWVEGMAAPRPAPVVSIAHLSAPATGGLPIAVAAAAPPGVGLGIDLGHPAQIRDPLALLHQAFAPAEAAGLGLDPAALAAPGADRPHQNAAILSRLMAAWVAKEAAAKALSWPFAGRERGFVVHDPAADGRQVVVSASPPTPTAPPCRVVVRLIRLEDGGVCGLCLLPPGQPLGGEVAGSVGRA